MAGETVVWHPVAGERRDSYRRAIKTFGADQDITGVLVAPGQTGPGHEPRARQSYRVISQMTIYLPSNPGVGAHDEFTVRGERYEIEGLPNDWSTGLTNRRFGTEITLRKVSG